MAENKKVMEEEAVDTKETKAEQTCEETKDTKETAAEETKETAAEEKDTKKEEKSEKKGAFGKKKKDKKDTQIEELTDRVQRQMAEFDNFRKRTLKEKAELIKNGGEKAINAILPILDDLERALQNMQKAEDVKAIYEGVELIYQKFLKNLHQEGLEKMEPVGEAFDTDFHEAVALVPAPSEEQKGKVLDCVQTGYKLNEKVIRHAKVVVAQ